MMNSDELREAEAIHREEALRCIAALVRRYEFTQDEVLQIWWDTNPSAAREVLPPTKHFDPFFEAW
jgi:hypothetical protein